MKNIRLIIPALLVLFSACSEATRNTAKSESTTETSMPGKTDSLEARIKVNGNVAPGDPLLLRFVVYNNTDSTKSFCIWHTPFEPLMSNYLSITNEKGEEAQYKGPMAKRVMLPPATSYSKVNAGDSLVANADLLKAYDLKKGSTYKVFYNGGNMSGLASKDTVTFIYTDLH
ncbi:protease [Pedobacter miscanthi]|uniref:Protease n=1 Tax=Pedobacter miscanthi TaxID=2259170 RepID=A0A366KNX6_9SPHI|nr:protease [Pedobacter miscanthi]RBQ02889.1 protease [Pedobacter miscanthi]